MEEKVTMRGFDLQVLAQNPGILDGTLEILLPTFFKGEQVAFY